MRKLTGLLIIIGMIIITGCTNTPSPNPTVSSFIEAGKKFDLTKMAELVNPSNLSSKEKVADLLKVGEAGANQPQQYFLDYFKENAAKITYSVTGSKIEKNQATFTVDFKYIDGEPLLKAVLRDAFSQAFSLASKGVKLKDEEMEKMLIAAMQKHKPIIQESYMEKSVDVRLIKVDRQWYIEQPSDELLDVFISNFVSVANELNKDLRISSNSSGQQVTTAFMDQAKKENLTIIPKTVGDEIILASLNLKVTTVEERQTNGAKFVIINVDVTNKTNNAFIFPPDLTVIDNKNREFKTYSNSINTIDNCLDNRKLSPGITENGNWLYELPSDAASYKLYVRKSGTKELFEILLR